MGLIMRGSLQAARACASARTAGFKKSGMFSGLLVRKSVRKLFTERAVLRSKTNRAKVALGPAVNCPFAVSKDLEGYFFSSVFFVSVAAAALGTTCAMPRFSRIDRYFSFAETR